MTTQEMLDLLYEAFEEQRKFHHNHDWSKQEKRIAGAEEILLLEKGRLSALIVKLETANFKSLREA